MVRHVLVISFTAVLASGAAGCLGSMLLGKVAKMRIVDTKIPNPQGTAQFLEGSKTLGCKSEITRSAEMGENLWVTCPPGVFTGVSGQLKFGFQEDKDNLTIGCDNGDRVYCDDPINKVLEAGKSGA